MNYYINCPPRRAAPPADRPSGAHRLVALAASPRPRSPRRPPPACPRLHWGTPVRSPGSPGPRRQRCHMPSERPVRAGPRARSRPTRRLPTAASGDAAGAPRRRRRRHRQDHASSPASATAPTSSASPCSPATASTSTRASHSNRCARRCARRISVAERQLPPGRPRRLAGFLLGGLGPESARLPGRSSRTSARSSRELAAESPAPARAGGHALGRPARRRTSRSACRAHHAAAPCCLFLDLSAATS